MTRRKLLILMLALAGPIGTAQAAERPAATLYKNPQCGCCEEYAKYLRQHGFTVKVVATHDLALIRKQVGGVSEKIEGCHTMLIDKYVVEGHVPVKTLDKLLGEKPAIRGISLPGMPEGSPGMSGRKSSSFIIYEIGNNASNPPVYATE